MTTNLEERTIAGLHDFLVESVISRHAEGRQNALDLGAGSGALSRRLNNQFGLDVTAVDLNKEKIRASVETAGVDFNDPYFYEDLEPADLVVSAEVIEHLESPAQFLRNIGRLLRDNGVAILTTPNVESLAARLKYFVSGDLRMMDEEGNLTHISPIFEHIFVNRLLPRVPLRLVERHSYPPRGYRGTRSSVEWLLKLMVLGGGEGKDWGDCHVFVLAREQ